MSSDTPSTKYLGQLRPRRSVLYMPGANARAMEKACEIDCDAIVFDLEDAVAPDAKEAARDQVLAALASHDYGYRELIVRGNGLDTPWGVADIEAFATAKIDAMLFPKVESEDQVAQILATLDAAGGETLPIWLMIETPTGVLDVTQFADHSRVEVLVMGTSDLVKELRAQHTPERHNIDYALQRCVLVARKLGKDILDGVHLDFRNTEAFIQVCASGRAMGFDGKTLIHPTQVAGANDVFGYSADTISEAQDILRVWQAALDEGKGVAVLDGRLIENLHAEEARRVVAFAEAMQRRI